MENYKNPSREEGDDPYHQQSNINPSFLLDQTPSMSSTVLESTSSSNIATNFYTDIFDMLPNVELCATLPPLPPTPPPPPAPDQSRINIGRSHDHHPVRRVLERGESSEQQKKPTSTSFSDDAEKRRRDSDSNATSRGDAVRPRRCRSTELHNMAERTRRDRIRRNMKALQDLIPNCNTRDKASMLDAAIKYIKSLQNQVKIMSVGGISMIQTPNILPAGYQMVQMPQFPQFMPMNPAGMGMFNFPSSSSSVPVMPFAFPAGPSQPFASGVNMNFGQMNQLLKMPAPAAAAGDPSSASGDSSLMIPTIASSSHGESSASSQCVPAASLNLSVKPQLMSQGLGSTVMVLPSQIVTPATCTKLVTNVPEIPIQDDDSDQDLSGI